MSARVPCGRGEAIVRPSSTLIIQGRVTLVSAHRNGRVLRLFEKHPATDRSLVARPYHLSNHSLAAETGSWAGSSYFSGHQSAPRECNALNIWCVLAMCKRHCSGGCRDWVSRLRSNPLRLAVQKKGKAGTWVTITWGRGGVLPRKEAKDHRLYLI